MLERIIIAVVETILRVFGKAASAPSTARDADRDVGTLRRGGRRIADWLRRQQDGVRSRGKPDADRPEG